MWECYQLLSPETLKYLLVAQLPEALIIGCPETENGAIAELPKEVDLTAYSAIACGPGLTLEAQEVVETVLESNIPIVLDADGLNIIAKLGTIAILSQRQVPTILTPHAGEFKRLFPDAASPTSDRIKAVRDVSGLFGAVVLLKGARSAIADHYGTVWMIPESTPALARGGSGDVLTGLLGGLLAQASSRKSPHRRGSCNSCLVAFSSWNFSSKGKNGVRRRCVYINPVFNSSGKNSERLSVKSYQDLFFIYITKLCLQTKFSY